MNAIRRDKDSASGANPYRPITRSNQGNLRKGSHEAQSNFANHHAYLIFRGTMKPGHNPRRTSLTTVLQIRCCVNTPIETGLLDAFIAHINLIYQAHIKIILLPPTEIIILWIY